MSDHHPQLGKLIEAGEQRDAIHIAIAPVVAAHTLDPGQHVGFTEAGNIELVGDCDHPIGIVDPFLPNKVRKGERFFMCMYPRSTTGAIRHSWEHPAFIGAEAARKLMGSEEAAQYLQEFADSHGLSFGDLIEGAKNVQKHGDWGGNVCANTDTDVPDEFWKNFELLTGLRAHERPSYIPCAC